MKSVLEFQKKKTAAEKITMVTCYDYTSACLLAKTPVDCLLVGDSAAMVMHGFDNTLHADMHMMTMHTAAVARGAKEIFIIADLPFLSYRKSLSSTVKAAEKIMKAGAHAIKLEGATGNIDTIKHLVQSGIPIMGHIGLTPQFLHQLGGWKVQGKTKDSAAQLLEDAIALEEAGCFSIVLECMPSDVAANISQRLNIPTIGIGAGSETDGQVLVLQDLLGLNPDFKPKFVKQFTNGAETITTAIETYVQDVKKGAFPEHEHSYTYPKVANAT